MKHVYLGWNNPRRAHKCPDIDVSILVNKDQYRILHAEQSRRFILDIGILNSVVCGIYDREPNKLVRKALSLSTDADRFKHACYNHIFDHYWRKAQ